MAAATTGTFFPFLLASYRSAGKSISVARHIGHAVLGGVALLLAIIAFQGLIKEQPTFDPRGDLIAVGVPFVILYFISYLSGKVAWKKDQGFGAS
jgi:hypothetical protein